MPTYRTKPVEIEAVQWTEPNQAKVEEMGAEIRWTEALSLDHPERATVVMIPQVHDKLQDTWVTINPGDYIIKGNKGEFYPCEQEVFNWKYVLIAP